MAKPIVHAASSARRYGGKMEDYFCLHDFMDKSKGAMPDNRHRALTHNSWFISTVIEHIFMPEHHWHGPVLINSAGRTVSTRQLAEDHVLEDFGGVFIPTASDYLQEMEIRDWMNNASKGTFPISHAKIAAKERSVRAKLRRTERPDSGSESRDEEARARSLERTRPTDL